MKYLLAIFLSLSIVACNNNESAQPVEQSSYEEPDTPIEQDSVSTSIEIEGMIRLENGTTTIGSNDKDYKANERPAMKVLLDYDFYMDIHEVTCGEYAKLAKKAKLKTFGKCENDSIPVVDITYYDAALFANAKSKTMTDIARNWRVSLFTLTQMHSGSPPRRSGSMRPPAHGTQRKAGTAKIPISSYSPLAEWEKIPPVSATWPGTRWNG